MIDHLKIDKKIFVVGTGRCGTTWIGHWLRQHPQVFGGHETHIIRILSEFLNPDWNQGLKTWISRDILLESMKQFIFTTLGQCKFRREGQIHFVEHSHCHYQHINLIQELFPEAYFVHIYRDGRNVVESKFQMGIKAELAISDWINTMKNMLIIQNKKVLNIQYETLECVQLSRQITSFLEIEHHKDVDWWEFPVNTIHFSACPDRWKTLPREITDMFERPEFHNILAELKYVDS